MPLELASIENEVWICRSPNSARFSGLNCEQASLDRRVCFIAGLFSGSHGSDDRLIPLGPHPINDKIKIAVITK